MRFEVCTSPCLSVGRSIDAPSAFVSKSAQTEANRRCPVEDLQLIVHSSKGPAERQSCSDSAEVWRQLHTGGVVWRHPTAWCEGHGDLAHRCYHAWRGESYRRWTAAVLWGWTLKLGAALSTFVLQIEPSFQIMSGFVIYRRWRPNFFLLTVQPHEVNLSRDILQSVLLLFKHEKPDLNSLPLSVSVRDDAIAFHCGGWCATLPSNPVHVQENSLWIALRCRHLFPWKG